MDRRAIIVLGGSFNPIHDGHMRCLRDARRLATDVLGYDVLACVLAAAPDGYVKQKMAKRGSAYLPANLRLGLIRAYIDAGGGGAGEGGCEGTAAGGFITPTRCYGSAWEYGKSLTQSVDAFRGATVLIVVGGDRAVGKWRRPQKPGTAMLCLCRGDAQRAELEAALAYDKASHVVHPGFHLLPGGGQDTSSTGVRAALAACRKDGCGGAGGSGSTSVPSGPCCKHVQHLLDHGTPPPVISLLYSPEVMAHIS